MLFFVVVVVVAVVVVVVVLVVVVVVVLDVALPHLKVTYIYIHIRFFHLSLKPRCQRPGHPINAQCSYAGTS